LDIKSCGEVKIVGLTLRKRADYIKG